MRVRITRDTVAGGRPVFVGEVLSDLSHEDALGLLALRKAVPVVEDEPSITHRDPVVAHRDPKPPTRRRR